MLIDRLSTLSNPHRMAVFRLLMRRCPDVLPAGEIAEALQFKASTASVYLSALTRVGLISQRREGTSLLYGINLEAARQVVSDLFMDCCRGRADLCPPLLSDGMMQDTNVRPQTYTVLFICTGNSARSILAETILRDMAGGTFTAYSAGTQNRSTLHPHALETLTSKGHDVSLLRAKNVSEYQSETAPKMDFVFTVCDRAANEECPPWAGQPVSAHWGLPDPVKAEGTDAQKRLAFQQTYGALHNRLSACTALPFAKLDRASLQRRIDDIGQSPLPKE